MGHVPRTSLPDGHFHVVSRGVAGAAVFRSDRDRLQFLRLLSSCERLHEWTCHAFSLMTTHYHLVIEARCADLSRGVQRLNGIYAREFNRRNGRFGHLFAERFSVRVIDNEEYLFEACAYVVLNPVRAGLCGQASDWPWSYSAFGLETA